MVAAGKRCDHPDGGSGVAGRIARRHVLGLAAGGLAAGVLRPGAAFALPALAARLPPRGMAPLPSSELFLPYPSKPIGGAGLGPGQVALSFDDGPHPTLTPLLLDTLQRYGVRATFFVIGRHAADHPDLVRRAIAEGHSVGTHTWSHRDLTRLPQADARQEIARAQEAVLAIDPTAPPFFRLPYGAGLRSTTLAGILADLKLYNVYWNMDSRDFGAGAASAEIVRGRCLDQLKRAGGGTLLLHDVHLPTVLMLPDLLDSFRESGVETVVLRPAAAPSPCGAR
jgi:peptidoglycan/xylan/chitin deacetylase (PgdA/CDA1 family)